MRVLVPFGKGNKTSVAFVYEIVENIKADYEIKEILAIIDERRIISNELMNMAFFMTKSYMSPIQASLRQVMPPTEVKNIITYYKSVCEEEKDLFKFLKIPKTMDEIRSKFGNIEDQVLSKVDQGKISISYDVKKTQNVAYDEFVSLKSNTNHILNKNGKKQSEIIELLEKNGKTNLKILLAKTKASKSSLISLYNKGYINIEKIEQNRELKLNYDIYKKHKLSKDQKEAFDKIKSNHSGQFLLFGVSGSGKTEIFLQIVEEVIKDGKEAIILVPEISLTPQTIERFKGRFKEKIAIIHSGLTPKERFNQWKMISNKEVKIAIGARSAIFAPFNNLGVVIIDEEHDSSYISSKDPKYHTEDLARFRAIYNNCNLILASATPSISTMKKTEDGIYELIHLKHRINKSMPKIEIVDLREELKKSNFSVISHRLREEIEINLKNKEQSILFLNKIGHDSFTFCRTCGYVVKCQACDVAMTYHKGIDRLVCHYCGRTSKQVRICPNCHSKKIKEFGAGTEKLEQEVKEIFKDARIMRMDSMVANNKKKYQAMYEGMKENKIDILLGTQMIAKGLDFKNVTLVGIISADLSLNVGDFRAQENTFQLLTQVAGRSGRAEKSGRVIIQTYRPDNFVIQAVKENDYMSFYNNELAQRKAFSYPPYKNIISLKVVNSNRINAIEISKEFVSQLRRFLKDDTDIDIIGPNPCKISRINNKYRYNIIIKSFDKDLEKIIKTINFIRNDFISKYTETSFIPALNPTNIN